MAAGMALSDIGGVNLIYPVTRYELNRLKKGDIANPHYHDVVQKGDTVMAVIGIHYDPREYDSVRIRGVDILNCKLKRKDLVKVKHGVLIFRFMVRSSPVNVMIMLDTDFKKIQEHGDGKLLGLVHKQDEATEQPLPEPQDEVFRRPS